MGTSSIDADVQTIMSFMLHGGTLDFGLLLNNDGGAQDLGIYKSSADFRAILVLPDCACAGTRSSILDWLRWGEEGATSRSRCRSGETQTSCVRNIAMFQAARASSS